MTAAMIILAGRQAGRQISPAFLGYTKEYRHTLDTVTA